MNAAFVKPLRDSSPGGFAVFVFCAPLLVGCGKPSPSAPSAPDAGVAEAREPERPELRLVLHVTALDGGIIDLPFERRERSLIDSTSAMTLSANLGIANYRVRVFDEANRAMVSDDEQRSGRDRHAPLDYQIRFPTPLKSGHRYVVVLDAETGATAVDSSGRTVAEQRLELQVRGEKEKPAPKKKPGRKRRTR